MSACALPRLSSCDITLKLIPLTIILAAATIFWIIRSLGSCIVIGGSVSIHSINLIPFSTLFRLTFVRPFFGAVGFTDFQTFPPYSYVFCCIPSKIANREQIQRNYDIIGDTFRRVFSIIGFNCNDINCNTFIST